MYISDRGYFPDEKVEDRNEIESNDATNPLTEPGQTGKFNERVLKFPILRVLSVEIIEQ